MEKGESSNKPINPSREARTVALVDLKNEGILSAASVLVANDSRQFLPTCLVLDYGSQIGLISEKLCNLLNIPKIPIYVTLSVVNNIFSCVNYRCNVRIASSRSNIVFQVSCLVLLEITTHSPSFTISVLSWELVEHLKEKSKSTEANSCESHFSNTFKRDKDGGYVVTILLKKDLNQLEESKETAMHRFLRLEKRYELEKEYSECERLGHILQEFNEAKASFLYYLSHYCIVRADSMTAKVRVVSNRSEPTRSWVSFNYLQMVGYDSVAGPYLSVKCLHQLAND